MGMEVVVRPSVFPIIRPTQPRVMPAAGSPDMVVLGGGGGTFVTTSYSYSYNFSTSKKKKEKKRQVDKKRVYQKDDKGTINKDNFVDIEQIKKVLLTGDAGTEPDRIVYAPYKDDDNVEILESDVTKFPDR